MAGTAFSAANWSGYDEQTWTPSASHTDFTLLIDVSLFSASWKAAVQSDGGDIRLTKGDGTTELAYDLNDWAYNAGSPTGFIRVLFSGSSGTSAVAVRCYAGYTPGTAVAYDATETYGSDNSYKSSCKGYWPLGEDASDRTSNGATPTVNSGGTPTFGVAADQPGNCVTLDGTDYFLLDPYTGVTDVPLTLMCWVKPDVVNSIDTAIGLTKNNGSEYVHLGTSFSKVRASTFDGTTPGHSAIKVPSADAWQHIAGRWVSSSSRYDVLNGVASTGNATTLNALALNDLAIGSYGAGNWTFGGEIQHAFLFNEAVSVAWIADEYAQGTQSTFWGTWSWTANAADASPPWSALKQPAFFTHLRR